MSPRILCYLPAERVSLCPLIFASKAIPVVDLCCSDRSRVPNGVWVRTRSKRDIPGKGPVILAGGQHRSPIRGRETWLEVTKPRKVPRGFAGIILRTKETGGWCSDKTLTEFQDSMDKLDPKTTMLDAGLSPDQWASFEGLGFAGTILSTQIISFSEFGLPPNLMTFLEQLNQSHLIHTQTVSVAAYPLSDGLHKLLSGLDWWKVSDGWLREDQPKHKLAPWGTSVLNAISYAQQHTDLSSFLRTYQTIQVSSAASLNTLANTPEIILSSETTASKTSDQNTSLRADTIVPRTIIVPPERSQEPIAIVGMGCRLPQANSLLELETLLRTGTYAIKEVPHERWNPELFWNKNPKAIDKTYSKIGGFIEGFEFKPKLFRIPPKVATQIDLVQQFTLMSVAEALEDASFTQQTSINKERVAVILGNSMGGESSDDHTIRTRLPEIVNQLSTGETFTALDQKTQKALLADLEHSKDHLPIINEDTMPGELANVIAGRIANAFDFNGPNYTVDAACASSMAAIQMAVKGLRDGEFDMAVTGGSDRSMGVPTYVKFSKIGALSADISAPFDERANGFVMGEGSAILILKRLSDAERDGDRIYSTIRSVGSSSDGKGKGITAPNPKGQTLALQRAYQDSNIDINSVDYFECHGTSTQVGDKVEATVLANELALQESKPRLGSIKSNIGHLKSAAGAAAMLKGALSIYHKTFYTTVNVDSPRTDIPLDKIQIQRQTESWESDKIRRVGVSAFGFGGTNFHVVLEEHQPTIIKHTKERILPLPQELTILSGSSQATLVQHLQTLLTSGDTHFSQSDPIRVVFSSADDSEQTTQCERLLESIEKDRNLDQLSGRGIFYTDFRKKDFRKSPHAFLFTGQGSQYLNMGMELAERFEIVQQTFDEAETIFQQEVGVSLRALIKGDPNLSPEDREAQLKDTRIAQPATLAMDIAIARLMGSFGVEADMVAGHSLGEYAACVVAGIMTFAEAIQAVSARGREMAAIVLEDTGKMASIAAGMDKVQPLLDTIEEYVIAANKNCPSQTVIAGSSRGVEAMIARCKVEKIRCQELPVSHAFHSKIVAPAGIPLKNFLSALELKSPHLPISTNVTGDWYPSHVPDIVEILSQQIASPVEWIKQINGLYAQGCKVFLECGPKRALTGLTSTTLKGLEHIAIHTNHPRRGEALSFIDSLGQLLSLGLINSTASAPTTSARERSLTQEIADLRAQLRQQNPTVSSASASVDSSSKDISKVNIVCTGASLGLPGGEQVFSEDNILRILHGENRLTAISRKMKNLFLMKDIVRVHKNPETGQGEFIQVNTADDCIQWAGQAQDFDFASTYNVDSKWAETLDITSKLAIAAGLEALKDAGVPLVEETRTTRSGLEQKVGWRLPKPLQADTGIVFASAFAGHTNFANHIARDGDDGTGQFDRRFLFQVLAMGHAQFAQLIGAKGPNTHVNAACASTTQAIAIAEDWIRCGRARRVIVIGADDVTNDTMMEWIGSGFLAVGAASTESTLSNAAKPFDKSRNGMILGMGAVGLLLEKQDDALNRGAKILATLRASRISNAAFHGTRLDVTHIASEMTSLVSELSKCTGLSPSELSTETVFVSHETFTPARGGSAEAEIEGIRAAFGPDSPSVLITNTKGFTGHAMGAGIEDVVAIKALQHQLTPPIPNLEQPDDSASDLHFSSGGTFQGKFAIRLAAGFGSQLVLLAWERGSNNQNLELHNRWLQSLQENNDGSTEPLPSLKSELSLTDSTTEPVQASTAITEKTIPSTANEPLTESIEEPTETPNSNPSNTSSTYPAVATFVLNTISEQTGYDIEDLELDYELEADLGIDTVKQAELFSELREGFSIADDIQIEMSAAPTIQSLINWFSEHRGESNPNSTTRASSVKTTEQTIEMSTPTSVSVQTNTSPTALRTTDLETTDLGFTPHLFRTQWVPSPIIQEDTPNATTFRFVGNTANDRHLTRALEQTGLRPTKDGQIIIERSRNIEEVFEAARALNAESIRHWLCILEVTTPQNRSAHIALKGGRSGLAKALGQEWSSCKSKVIWVNSKITPKELATIIRREVSSIDSVNEVYYEHDDRYALTLQRESFPKPPKTAPKTIVFSGGGRGITAEVAKGFIKNGCQEVFLLGRTEPTADPLDFDAEKIRIKGDLQKTGLKVTPVMIATELERLKKADTVRQNIQEMTDFGATVTFIQTNIASRQSVDDAFSIISAKGIVVDAVVHGAGTEESRPLAEKDTAAFRRIYHPKVQGALNILENIPSSTFFLSMGSIAGRFGNQGQSDYSAANDAVAYVCQQRNNALHICWSAWADVGMASRGGMDHLLTSKGIDLLPVDFAVQQSIAMLEHRFLGEVIVAGSLGDLPMPSTQPLIQYATLGSHGIHGHTTFNPIDSKWLQDHSIGDTPIFPGVMGLELMAQSIATIQPKQIHSIERVNFERPIKFHRNQRVDFEVTTQFHVNKVDCTLYSVRKLAGNRTQKTLHFTATMRIENPSTHSLLSEEPLQPCVVSNEDIYRQFFHGPSFQVLESVSSMSTKESISTGILDHMSILPSHNISPLAIESAFQAAGWHHWTQTQEMVLPKSIESLQIFDLPTDWEGLTMRAQPVLNKPRTYNVDVFQNHSIVMTLRNLEFIQAPPTSNNEKDFWTPEPDVVIARSQENLHILPSNDRMSIESRGSLKRQQDRIAGRTAAYRLLRKEGIASNILQENSGKPYLQDSSADISISHSNGIGWAALHHNGRIGMDVEQIIERSSAFLRDWFTEGERRLCEENTSETELLHTIIWTIKEALSKLLGTGFRIHPTCFEVRSINRELQTCEVEFHDEAHTQWMSLNPVGSLMCRWINLDTEILSFVTVLTPKVRSIC